MNAEQIRALHQAAFGPQSRRLTEETRAALYRPRRTPQIDGGVLDSTRARWEVQMKLKLALEDEGGFADGEELRERLSVWTREELTAAREEIGAECVQSVESGRWYVLLAEESP